MSNSEGKNPNKTLISDSGTENNTKNETNQIQNTDGSQTLPDSSDITPRKEEVDNNILTCQTYLHTVIKNTLQSHLTEDPLWTLNNVASPQVLDWHLLDRAKVVVMIKQ